MTVKEKKKRNAIDRYQKRFPFIIIDGSGLGLGLRSRATGKTCYVYGLYSRRGALPRCKTNVQSLHV